MIHVPIYIKKETTAVKNLTLHFPESVTYLICIFCYTEVTL